MNFQELFEQVVPEETRQKIVLFCKVFSVNDFQCWLVGGAVRDILSGKEPKDFDFATDMPLETIKKSFKKVISTGEDHGTLTVLIDDQQFEVTQFRKDVETDGRRATVEFASTIQEDLSRRDFTINAIAVDPLSGEVVDPFGGMENIENKKVRFVGNVEDRILEDHLRALRFVRFIARYCHRDRLFLLCIE